jgi:hypothetical protein
LCGSQDECRRPCFARRSSGDACRRLFPQGRRAARCRVGRPSARIESPGDRGDKGDNENGTDRPARGQPVQANLTTRDELRQGFFGRSEARLVFVNEELPVEFEVVRVSVQKPPDVGIAGHKVEAFVLERLEIPRTDARLRLDLSKLDAAANSHLAEAAADLEHPFTFPLILALAGNSACGESALPIGSAPGDC